MWHVMRSGRVWARAGNRQTAETIARKNRRKGRRVWIRRIRPHRSYHWVTGDKAGVDKHLLAALNRVGKDINNKVYIRSGKRSYAEQAALYAQYGPGRAARPGTSRHETGLAADCQVGDRNGPNLASHTAARAAMHRHNVCPPVAGEPWHIELGNVWRA